MMISMLTVALVGNLLMLPAILAGPAGALFAWGIRRKQARAEARRKRARERIRSDLPVGVGVGAGAGAQAVPEPHLQPEKIGRSYRGG